MTYGLKVRRSNTSIATRESEQRRVQGEKDGSGAHGGPELMLDGVSFMSTPVNQHPAYKCWKTMRQRCLNPNNPNFARYGGRGITIDRAWDDFATFARDMGERPAGATLERIDNDRGYDPGNVRWASRWEQGQNRHHTQMVEHDGRVQSISAWVRELGNPHKIPDTTIRARVVRFKWDIARALKPTKTRHPVARVGKRQMARYVAQIRQERIARKQGVAHPTRGRAA